MYFSGVSHQVFFATERFRTSWLLTDEHLGAWAHVHLTLVPAKIFGIPEGVRAFSVVMVALVALGFREIVGLKMLPAVLSALWSGNTYSTRRT